MPRKSAAAQAIKPASTTPAGRSLLPGSHLSDAASEVFGELVGSVSAGHFLPVDRVMIEELAVAIHIARELAGAIDRDGVMDGDRVMPAVKVLKQQQALIGQLASRLRLTTQNRVSKDRAATAARDGAPSISELYESAGSWK